MKKIITRRNKLRLAGMLLSIAMLVAMMSILALTAGAAGETHSHAMSAECGSDNAITYVPWTAARRSPAKTCI